MGYNKPAEQDIREIIALTDPERCLIGDDIGEDFRHDELGGSFGTPDVLVHVMTTQEVSGIMKLASRRNIPVVARGSGTGLVGAAVAVKGGIMLETTRMNRILELDENNLTVTVQPGVLLMELAEYAAGHGFLYPPDPGEKSATIGGNISTNAGGMRAVKYGVTRDYVRALTVVLPDGEIMRLGGKVVKNSSGYSLKDLIIGSEGTLAIITEAVLSLVSLPQVTVSLLVPFDTMEQALRTVPIIIRSKAKPTAIEYMSRDTLLFSEEYLGKKFPDMSHAAYLLLTFDGDSMERVEEDYGFVADLCLENDARDAFIVDTEERKDAIWSARGAFLEAIKASTTEMDECDVVVPRDLIADFITYTHRLAAELEMRIPSFGHAGDGNLHVYLCRDKIDGDVWQEKMQIAFGKMYAKAEELGGLVSGEHGIGSAKRDYLRRSLGEGQIALMRRIKAAFDPQCILNPGKVCR